MEQDCHVVKTGRIANTSGEEESVLICYCGTTACTKGLTKYYPLPKDFSAARVNLNVPPELDCDCEYETVLKDGSVCGKCQKRFYKVALG